MELTRRGFLKLGAAATGSFILSSLPLPYSRASQKLEGLCYSPFRDGQSPELGIFPSLREIEEDMSILSSMTSTIRTYGVDRTLRHIPRACAEKGIACHAGGWISGNPTGDERTLQDLVSVGNEGYASSLIVGNEVLLWETIAPTTLINYISWVKERTGVPVTTSDVWDRCLDHPDVMEELDYIITHVHPYWEGIPVESAAAYVMFRWNEVKERYPHKLVILGETGWPTGGNIHLNAVPGEGNQKRFIEDLKAFSDGNYLFFEAFDEEWKRGSEGEVGVHWGLLYSDGRPKYAAETLLSVIGTRTQPRPKEETSGGGCFITAISR